MKTICVYHSRDLDGWMSAAIVKKWWLYKHTHNPNKDTIEYLGWDYGDKIPDLSGYDKVIMVDIAFPYSRMVDLFKIFDTNFIWIDHHLSAIKDVLGENAIIEHQDTTTLYNGLRRTDYAACELTWQYFFSNATKMPEIVRLLGRYDCFGHKGTDEEQKVLEFQYVSRAYISNYENAYQYLEEWISDPEMYLQSWLITGRDIYKYLCTEARQTYKKAFPIMFQADGGGRLAFLCVNQERFNPINFGIDYHKDGYDGFACFWLKDGKWNWSLYNDNGKVDCSVIAKLYGGGGHKGAAGMVIKDLSIIF